MFAGGPIPYPKREFLSDEEQDDKSDNKVSEEWKNIPWIYFTHPQENHCFIEHIRTNSEGLNS